MRGRTAFGAMGAFIAALLALSACGGGVVHNTYTSSHRTRDHARLAVSDPPILAVLRGNPFAGDAGDAAVVDAMQAAGLDTSLAFATTPRPGSANPYKVVLLFGRTSDPQANACAQATPAFSAAPAGALDVTAAFCTGELLLSQVVGSMAAPGSPRDPNFRALLGQVMTALLRPPMQSPSVN
jgi:hypothetical protein